MNDDEMKNLHEARNQYIENLNNQSDLFDNKLLWLSAGSFGLILTFIKNIVNPPFKSILFLFLSLSCLALSILITLFSFLVSQNANKKLIKKIDDCINNNVYFNEKAEFKSIEIINWFAFISFAIGIILIILFIILNLSN